MAEPTRRGRWDQLDTPVKVIGGIVAILVAGISTYLAVAGNPFSSSPADLAAQTNPAVVAARQIMKCEAQHGLHSPRVVIHHDYYPSQFERCDWPPLIQTSADGYSALSVRERYEPHHYGGDPGGELDTFHAPCDELAVTYEYGFMGIVSFASHRVKKGRVYLVAEQARPRNHEQLVFKHLDQVPPNVEIPGLFTNAFFVLHSGHDGVNDARCVAGS